MTLPSPIKCPPFLYSKNEPGIKKESYLPKSPTSPIPYSNNNNKKRSSLTGMPYTETISSLSRKHTTLLKEIQETKQLLEETNLKQHKYHQLHQKQEKANKKITLKHYYQYHHSNHGLASSSSSSSSPSSTLVMIDWEKKVKQSEKEYELAKQKYIQTKEQLKLIQSIYYHDLQQQQHENHHSHSSKQHHLSLLKQLLDLIQSLKTSYDQWIYQIYYTYPYYLFLANDHQLYDPTSSTTFVTTLNTLNTSIQSHIEKDQSLLKDMDQSITYFTEISNQYCEDIVSK
ncbi:unnamed protein product [Cunninghamella blakesleeana]